MKYLSQAVVHNRVWICGQLSRFRFITTGTTWFSAGMLWSG
ncbi:hypothetical protein BMS3Bbin02_01207 [bacterium BMS3Bbin02]|nr:hypothetical protein BMS3Bbin02_01207 [bacterium BMS3Bbin02]